MARCDPIWYASAIPSTGFCDRMATSRDNYRNISQNLTKKGLVCPSGFGVIFFAPGSIHAAIGRPEMQTANTQDLPDAELQRTYTWASDEEAMVNAIIGAAWHNQMSMRTGLRPNLARIMRGLVFRGRRDSL